MTPFTQKQVVVQSTALKRWLAIQLAQKNGICSNIDFKSPTDIIENIFAQNDKTGLFRPFTKEQLLWQTFRILSNPKERQSDYPLIDKYVSQGDTDLRLYKLAEKIADLFDQYTVYRRDLLAAWSHGKRRFSINGNLTNQGSDETICGNINHETNETWQMNLWNAITESLSFQPADDFDLDDLADITELPDFIPVFGISVLPELHLKIFKEFSKKSNVLLYVLSPYAQGFPNKTKNTSNLEYQLGKTGQEFLESLQKTNDGNHILLPSAYDKGTLLGRTKIAAVSETTSKQTVAANQMKQDTSLSFASCYGPRREVEAVHDHLLDLLEKDKSLKPSDIAILTPDVNLYGDYIEAVFGTESQDLFIPYTVVGKTIEKGGEIASVFLSLLHSLTGRFTLSEIIDPLECEALRANFKLNADDVSLIRKLAESNHIYWGRDKQQIAANDLPPVDVNTWKYGFRKILTGFMMDPVGQTLPVTGETDILPAERIGSNELNVVGSFLDYLSVLEKAALEVFETRSFTEWRKWVTNLFENLFQENFKNAGEIYIIRNLFAQRQGETVRTDDSCKISHVVFREWIRTGLAGSPMSFGLFSRGVTVGNIADLNGIPFKVICLIGMNEDAFPGKSRQPAFDLQTVKPRAGDRQKREGDQYLFLETIFSAKEKLYISYSGHNDRDNAELMPATPVCALQDLLKRTFSLEKIENDPERDIVSALTTEHPLQAFSHHYFKSEENNKKNNKENCQEEDREKKKYRGKPLFTYHKENFINTQAKHDTEPLFKKLRTSGKISQDFYTIQPDHFANFFKNPSEYFVKHVLGAVYSDPEEKRDDMEPFALGSLEEYQLKQKLVKQFIEQDIFTTVGESFLEKIYDHEYLKGSLPYGYPGKLKLKELVKEKISPMAEMFKNHVGDSKKESIPFKSHIFIPEHDTLFVDGEIPNVYGNTIIVLASSKIKQKYIIPALIIQRLLAANDINKKIVIIGEAEKAKKDEGKITSIEYTYETGSTSELITVGNKYMIKTPNPANDIKTLGTMYINGLKHALPFFPETSYTYWERSQDENCTGETLIHEANSKWEKRWDGSPGEKDQNVYLAQLYKDFKLYSGTTLNSEFTKVSSDIYNTLYGGTGK